MKTIISLLMNRFPGVAALGLLLTPGLGRAANPPPFYLHSGDKVCFYGDSITEQRYYGADIETYVRTRFPDLHVKFVNSGVGGDKVTGGWAGPIDQRLARDVFPFKPNVVTIMLGMNDARYRPFDPAIFAIYTNGYEHIIQSLQTHLPGARIVLIEPSPYDDVSEPSKFPGGYNGVLLRYAAFVRQLAAEHHLLCVDLNTPLANVIKEVKAKNPQLAHDVIPGRVHPSAAGQLVMAQGILEAWHAPAMVTLVAINARRDAVTRAEGTTVSDLKKADGTLSWTQHDRCLPFPILALHADWPQFPPMENPRMSRPFFWPSPSPKWDYTNAVTEAVVKASGFYPALDEEPLEIRGLPAGDYRLAINGQIVGSFSAANLDQGVNLAEYRTPMLEQSYHVLHLVWEQVEWRFFAWRGIQLRLRDDSDPQVQKTADALVAALYAQKNRDAEQQYAAAQPRETHYELMPVAR
jgi:lysophospholipase L1-like esterase